VPVVTVPRVVMFALPAQVDKAVFSTLPKPTSDEVRVTTPVLPATLVTGAVVK
jgi:hypothetical protein